MAWFVVSFGIQTSEKQTKEITDKCLHWHQPTIVFRWSYNTKQAYENWLYSSSKSNQICKLNSLFSSLELCLINQDILFQCCFYTCIFFYIAGMSWAIKLEVRPQLFQANPRQLQSSYLRWGSHRKKQFRASHKHTAAVRTCDSWRPCPSPAQWVCQYQFSQGHPGQ